MFQKKTRKAVNVVHCTIIYKIRYLGYIDGSKYSVFLLHISIRFNFL